MAIGAAIAGGLASAVGGKLIGDAVGGDSRRALKEFRPVGIRAGGLTGRLTRLPGSTGVGRNQQVIGLESSAERQSLITNIQDLLSGQADETSALREEFLSGVGALAEARLNRISDARRRTVGNLRENLARRRVLGSSFAQDAIARAQAEFGREEAEAEARSSLQQLDIKRQLIDREFGLRERAAQTALNDLNFQSKLAASLATGSTSALAANAQAQAQIAAQQAEGLGALAGLVGTSIFTAQSGSN